MRQILFRGKTIEKDEWIEGYLVQGQWYYADKPMTVIIPTDITFYPRCEISGYEDVDPETVGQWTGLVDKNGKKIFEGDILIIDDNWEYPCPVIFDDHFAWCCTCEKIHYHYRHRLKKDNGTKYEVIGNIWDNPELVSERSEDAEE